MTNYVDDAIKELYKKEILAKDNHDGVETAAERQSKEFEQVAREYLAAEIGSYWKLKGKIWRTT